MLSGGEVLALHAMAFCLDSDGRAEQILPSGHLAPVVNISHKRENTDAGCSYTS